MRQTLLIQAAAPAKPPLKQPCNGCGICCAAEPCPVGRWLPDNRHGPCRALEWDGAAARYWCGLVRRPAHYIRWLPDWLGPWFSRRVLRRIASGRGCDSDAEMMP